MKNDRPLTSDEKLAARRLRQIWDQKKKDLELTQEKVAHAMHITQGAVSHYLNGRIPIGPLAAMRFAHILEVAPEEIIEIQNITPPSSKGANLDGDARRVFDLLEWLDRDELDELIVQLEAVRDKKMRMFEFVRARKSPKSE